MDEEDFSPNSEAMSKLRKYMGDKLQGIESFFQCNKIQDWYISKLTKYAAQKFPDLSSLQDWNYLRKHFWKYKDLSIELFLKVSDQEFEENIAPTEANINILENKLNKREEFVSQARESLSKETPSFKATTHNQSDPHGIYSDKYVTQDEIDFQLDKDDFHDAIGNSKPVENGLPIQGNPEIKSSVYVPQENTQQKRKVKEIAKSNKELKAGHIFHTKEFGDLISPYEICEDKWKKHTQNLPLELKSDKGVLTGLWTNPWNGDRLDSFSLLSAPRFRHNISDADHARRIGPLKQYVPILDIEGLSTGMEVKSFKDVLISFLGYRHSNWLAGVKDVFLLEDFDGAFSAEIWFGPANPMNKRLARECFTALKEAQEEHPDQIKFKDLKY